MSKPITPRQRLAAVMGKCFDTQTKGTRDEWRHAVLSAKMKRAIVSSEDLTDREVQSLLTDWEHHDAVFSPSERGRKEIAELAAATRRNAGKQK